MEANGSRTDAEDLALVVDAAAEAGRIAMRYWRNDPEQWLKDGRSPVSEADIEVDRFLREHLLRERPGYGWVSEEMEEGCRREPSGGSCRSFIADPIDGTRAYLEGRETWGVALAVVENGRPVAAALACPALSLDYAARTGGGATRNDETIRIRPDTDEPRIAGPRGWLSKLPGDYGTRVVRVPYIPSLAYRVAMVADGSIDGTFIRPSAHDWDIAASDLLLTEAGGSLVRSDGGAPIYGSDNARHGYLVAATATELPRMLDMARRTGET